MKNKILTSIITSMIIGSSVVIGYTTPTISPVSSITNTGGIFSQYFENISQTGTVTNPIIVRYNSLSDSNPAMPVFISADIFITNFLKTLGVLPWDNVLNGFTSTGNVMTSSMTTLVKGYLNGKNATPNYAITEYDADGNMLQSRDVGYWMGSLPSGIEYINGNVSIGGSIRLYGNASSKDATSSNHLITKGQVDTQINDIKNILKY